MKRKQEKEPLDAAAIKALEEGGYIVKRLPVAHGYAPEFRDMVMQDAIAKLAQGFTLEAIGKHHGLTAELIGKWLLAERREDAEQARLDYLSGELMAALIAIKTAGDPMALAKARETFRAVGWLAERRLPQHFGNNVTVRAKPMLDLGERLREARDRVNARLIEARNAEVTQEALAERE